jgi:DNA polymerase III epsilon subunit-like protein
MTKYNDYFAWMDTETSGLDCEKHRVLEIAISLTRGKDRLEIIKEFEAKIFLSAQDYKIAEPRALEVNGYTTEEWEKCGAVISNKEVWQQVQELTAGATIANQNPRFDMGFVEAEMKRYGLVPSWQRRPYDVTTYSIVVMRALNVRNENGWPSASLADVYRALKAPPLPAEHRAMPDVRRAQFLHNLFVPGIHTIIDNYVRQASNRFKPEVTD